MDSLKYYCLALKIVETRKEVVLMNGNSRFRFEVLHGKQHEMEYMVVGFGDQDFPTSVRNFPRMKFVPPDAVSKVTGVPSTIQAALIHKKLDEDDLQYIKTRLLRAGVPSRNILYVDDARYWTQWFIREFRILTGSSCARTSKASLIVGCPSDELTDLRVRNDLIWWPNPSLDECESLPAGISSIFLSQTVLFSERREIENHALRVGIPLINFENPKELMDLLGKTLNSQEVKPQVAVLGVNLSAIPEIGFDPLYRCYSPYDLERLSEFPSTIRLAIVVHKNNSPHSIQRMRSVAASKKIKFVELAGGTGDFKKWFQRTDVARELQLIGRQAEPIRPVDVNQSNLDEEVVQDVSPIEILDEVPLLDDELGSVQEPKTFESKERTGRQMKKNEGPTLPDLIKEFWVEAGDGDSRELHRLINASGRKTSIGNVYAAKSYLINKVGWKPPRAGKETPSEQIPKRASIMAKKSVVQAPADGGSVFDKIQRGTRLITEGLGLIQEAVGAVNLLEERNKLMEPMFAALEQVRLKMQK